MIDEKILKKHYQQIAGKLYEMIPGDWYRIVIYAEETGNTRGG